jgi:hypothetical protein
MFTDYRLAAGVRKQQQAAGGNPDAADLFSLSQFDGMDGHDLTGLLFTGGTAIGKFSFQIDDARFR